MRRGVLKTSTTFEEFNFRSLASNHVGFIVEPKGLNGLYNTRPYTLAIVAGRAKLELPVAQHS